MLDIKPFLPEPDAAVASFEPYGRLLRMLMPSLKGVVIHDALCNLAWASEDWDLADELDFAKEAISNALADPHEFPGVVHHDADSAVYSFAMRGEHVESLGAVSLLVRLSGARTEARPLSYIRQLVQPALECLRRELSLRSKLGSREHDLGVRERDLSLMLEMSSTQSSTGEADEFDSVLKAAIEHMDCALVALWVPDKNIGLSMTRSGNPMSPESLHRAQQHLMAWMQLQQRTIVVNHISKVASDVAAPYKILACPVRHPSERVMGVMALFNPASAHDFDSHQTRVAELLAKKVTVIIQAQYDAGTGLMTRHSFERQAKSLLAAATETAAHSILYLDIDRLHVINETFGMHVGDDVIVSVAECMAKALAFQGAVGPYLGRPARRAHPGLVDGGGRRTGGAHPGGRRRHRAARRPGIVRGFGLVGRRPRRARRECAGARLGHRGDRLQSRQGSGTKPGRSVPGFGSEHHPAPYGHPGDRQAP